MTSRHAELATCISQEREKSFIRLLCSERLFAVQVLQMFGSSRGWCSPAESSTSKRAIWS